MTYVKKKIQNLHNVFKKEYTRIQDSKRSEASRDDLYETILWYYEQLVFTVQKEPLHKSVVVMAEREEGGERKKNNWCFPQKHQQQETLLLYTLLLPLHCTVPIEVPHVLLSDPFGQSTCTFCHWWHHHRGKLSNLFWIFSVFHRSSAQCPLLGGFLAQEVVQDTACGDHPVNLLYV